PSDPGRAIRRRAGGLTRTTRRPLLSFKDVQISFPIAMLNNNGTAVSGDPFWDSMLSNNCAEGEEEVFRLFADCQTPLSRFMSEWFGMGAFFSITFICVGISCWCFLETRSVTLSTVCSCICLAWVIAPPCLVLLEIYSIAIITLMEKHLFSFYLCLFFVGVLGGNRWIEDRRIVSRSDRRWHCRGWLIMLKARHDRATAWGRSSIIREDLEGPTSRLLQAGWRGSTLSTSLPPSFLRYTDHISGEFRHPESL
ncbi:unnamed protein product, partial [Ascophyllum nodosum]